MRGQRIAIFLLSLGLLGVGWWGWQQKMMKEDLEKLLSNHYQRSFYNLADHVGNAEMLLGKSLVAMDPKANAAILADLWYEAITAQENLGQLPLSNSTTVKTAKFLNQLGDYAYFLNKRNAEGKLPGKKEREQLQKLYRQAQKLNAELQVAVQDVQDGRVYLAEVRRESGSTLGRQARKPQPLDMKPVAKAMQDTPALIYDGPFSEHLERALPRGLSGENITLARAMDIARSFIDGQGKVWEVRTKGDVRGKIPAFSLELVPAGKTSEERIIMDISKKGGKVIWMLHRRKLAEPVLSAEEAEKRAVAFARLRGYDNLAPTYVLREDGIATVALVAVQDGVLLYPDLVKIKVALDNGQILGFEATGYLMSHIQRQLPPVLVKPEAIKKKLPPELKVEHIKLALIPTPSRNEILCWEVKGKLAGELYYEYFNVKNGSVEKVLKVIETQFGSLTM
ncbi:MULTISPECIES: germination protein YpeB [Carboxydocella]|uniref:Germination protein YpeB n=2 Tax=Carboxydocella TaxID=178898 RepID=A0A1T4NIC8_9FIRM|nr:MULTISPECIES: germination protein YpeB [Carboxydocella]AVX20053.1 germination protein YpeB [Carboxydocella thermautotrophica]AVX30470.1 germination protein YpeB [Carboxydocella thermautotrophica]SJZ78883.1 germination protein YpeB [Carboxydocella sporoproducens DSM 16521]GAW27871.1 germination protein YpeB [Carboxydocella sp. ULO1]GAW31638.1 germination protein YpeB [Carboxydocella sp. JDF658]